MALAAHQTQGVCTERTSQPLTWMRAKVGISIGYRSTRKIGKQITRRSNHRLSFVNSKGVRHCFPRRNLLLKASSFQDVTKDDDTGGGDVPVSPTASVAFPCVWQGMKGVKQNILHTSRVFPSWLSKLQKQGFIQGAKAIFQQKQVSTENSINYKKVLQLQKSELKQAIVEHWQKSEVWIKWPLALFLICFLTVTILYGGRASMDLLPLWIVGPLVMGSFIKLYLMVSPLMVSPLHACITANARVTTACSELYLSVKDGNVMKVMQLKYENVMNLLMSKRSEVVCYIRSEDFKELLTQKLKVFKEWSSDLCQDSIEFIWPHWRATLRFLKKIFSA